MIFGKRKRKRAREQVAIQNYRIEQEAEHRKMERIKNMVKTNPEICKELMAEPLQKILDTFMDVAYMLRERKKLPTEVFRTSYREMLCAQTKKSVEYDRLPAFPIQIDFSHNYVYIEINQREKSYWRSVGENFNTSTQFGFSPEFNCGENLIELFQNFIYSAIEMFYK